MSTEAPTLPAQAPLINVRRVLLHERQHGPNQVRVCVHTASQARSVYSLWLSCLPQYTLVYVMKSPWQHGGLHKGTELKHGWLGLPAWCNV